MIVEETGTYSLSKSRAVCLANNLIVCLKASRSIPLCFLSASKHQKADSKASSLIGICIG